MNSITDCVSMCDIQIFADDLHKGDGHRVNEGDTKCRKEASWTITNSNLKFRRQSVWYFLVQKQ